jgi:hypothetical protein
LAEKKQKQEKKGEKKDKARNAKANEYAAHPFMVFLYP